MVNQPNDEEKNQPSRAESNRPEEESKDFVADIRQEMSQEEAKAPVPRPGLLKRVTGMLRRQKAAENPSEPSVQPEISDNLFMPANEPVLRSVEIDDEIPAPELDNDFLARRLLVGDATQDEPGQGVFIDDTPTADEAAAAPDPEWLPFTQANRQAPPAVSPLASKEDQPDDASNLLAQWMTDEDQRDTHPALFASDDAPSSPPLVLLETEDTRLGEMDALQATLMTGDNAAPTPGQHMPDPGVTRQLLFDDDLMEPQVKPPATGSSASQPDGSASQPDGSASQPDDSESQTDGSESSAPPPVEARPRGLRGLLTGILRSGDQKKKDLADENQMDDRVVTSRLSRSLGKDISPEEDDSALLEARHEPMTLSPDSPNEDDDEPHWDNIILAAGPILIQRPATQPAGQPDTPQADSQPPEPDDSLPAQPQPPAAAAFIADDILGPEQEPVANLPDGQETIKGRLSSIQPEMTEQDRLYWEGASARPFTTSGTNPMTPGMEEHNRIFWEGPGADQATPVMPIDELRSVLLENYDERGAYIEVDEDLEVEPGHSPQRKVTLSKLERAMLAILALLAILLAVSLSLLFIRPPEQIAAIIVSRPTGAPAAGAMLPTGLELPGGWYFGLERNTLEDGKWKPQAAEWLEGSELPRVVAIPWNRQTEAVIQTFETGDELKLSFGNNDTIVYKVREVKRVEINDVSIFQNRRPSLVLVLYQENADQRWVIICGK